MIGIVAPVIAFEQYIEAQGETVSHLCLHPGGQGVHVARIVQEHGESCALATFVGGELAPVLRALLDQYQISHRLVTTQTSTAAVLKLTHDYQEIAAWRLPPPKVNRHEADNLFETASLLVLQSRAVVLIGTLCEGLPADFFVRLVSLANRHGVPTVLDVPAELLELAVRAGPTIVKPGKYQLAELLDLGPSPTEAELVRGARRLCDWGAGTVLVSLAAEGALAVGKDWAWRIRPPVLEVVEQAGAGDCMASLTAIGLAQGQPLEETFRTAVAAGMAKVMRHGLGTCKREITQTLREKVLVEYLDGEDVQAA